MIWARALPLPPGLGFSPIRVRCARWPCDGALRWRSNYAALACNVLHPARAVEHWHRVWTPSAPNTVWAATALLKPSSNRPHRGAVTTAIFWCSSSATWRGAWRGADLLLGLGEERLQLLGVRHGGGPPAALEVGRHPCHAHVAANLRPPWRGAQCEVCYPGRQYLPTTY